MATCFLFMEYLVVKFLYLYNKNIFSCEEWIKMVSSKGGTTEAAMNCYKEQNLSSEIISGAQAAKLQLTPPPNECPSR